MLKNIRSLLFLMIIPTISLVSKNSTAADGEYQDLCVEKYFTCNLSGKPVNFCGAEIGDYYHLLFVIGDTIVADLYKNDILTLSEFNSGKANLISIYFKSNGKNYAITTCDGMECNPDKSAWISVLKGKNKLKEGGFCSPESRTGFTGLPFKEDAKGRLALDKKNGLNSYFKINKNPKEPFLTENISWSE